MMWMTATPVSTARSIRAVTATLTKALVERCHPDPSRSNVKIASAFCWSMTSDAELDRRGLPPLLPPRARPRPAHPLMCRTACAKCAALLSQIGVFPAIRTGGFFRSSIYNADATIARMR